MATIQFKRQLKFANPKNAALKYIREKLVMQSGEPLICTYRESNGKWGAIEVICVYQKGTPKDQTIITDDSFFIGGELKENYIKINDDYDLKWGSI